MRDLTHPHFQRARDAELEVAMSGLTHPNAPDFGAFRIERRERSTLRVIACAGAGWDHVSVSVVVGGRCPTWDEMSYIHRLFFKPEETAMQLHVPESDHISYHPYTLHLWRPHSKLKQIPRPPGWMVGPSEKGAKRGMVKP